MYFRYHPQGGAICWLRATWPASPCSREIGNAGRVVGSPEMSRLVRAKTNEE